MTPEEWQEFQEWKEFKEWKEFTEFKKASRPSPAPAPEPVVDEPQPPPDPEQVKVPEPRPILVSHVTDEIWIEHTSDWECDVWICWGKTCTKTPVGRVKAPGPVIFWMCFTASDCRNGFGLSLIQKWINRDVRPRMPPDYGYSP